MNSNVPVKTILILAANPKGTKPLRLDEEVREIEERLRGSKYRDRFVVEQRWAVRPQDIQQALLDCKPQIVHFSGHGGGEKGLVLENEAGDYQLASAGALAGLFELFAESVECVLLNACYSEVQAKAIAHHIGAVIGMNQKINDRASIAFARSFYNALGAGENVEFAYKLGCNAMELGGDLQHLIPALVRREEVQRNPQHIFISYKRDVDPDSKVALQLFEALSRDSEVFIDQTMLVGTRWAERIEAEINRTDALIVLLSARSVQSEMMQVEVELAARLAKARQGRPLILPVRLDYRDPLPYPLSEYLNAINWAMWEGEADTPQLIAELQQAVREGTLAPEAQTELPDSSESAAFPYPFAAAQPLSLEMPEGTMTPESAFSVERPADAVALKTIERQGVTLTIKGPRQMGKSSLLNRIKDAALKAGKQVAFLDFQLFDRAALLDADCFFRQFCDWLTDELEVEDKVEDLRSCSNLDKPSRAEV